MTRRGGFLGNQYVSAAAAKARQAPGPILSARDLVAAADRLAVDARNNRRSSEDWRVRQEMGEAFCAELRYNADRLDRVAAFLRSIHVAQGEAACVKCRNEGAGHEGDHVLVGQE